MSHQVPWSRQVIDVFAEEMLLSEEEVFILETRAKSWSVSKQAQYLNCSESRVAKMISNLKKKYDIAQTKHPDIMPERKFSAEEIYMDNH